MLSGANKISWDASAAPARWLSSQAQTGISVGVVLRVIHTIHQALMHQSLFEKSRFNGEGRCPCQTGVPALAGKLVF
jgi:hypothetical protein